MYEDIRNWLCTEAQQRNIQAVFHIDRAEPHNGWLKLPVRIEGDDLDAGDRVELLGALEDSWNDKEPTPTPRLRLSMTKK